jgi:hypothetical protein
VTPWSFLKSVVAPPDRNQSKSTSLLSGTVMMFRYTIGYNFLLLSSGDTQFPLTGILISVRDGYSYFHHLSTCTAVKVNV